MKLEDFDGFLISCFFLINTISRCLVSQQQLVVVDWDRNSDLVEPLRPHECCFQFNNGCFPRTTKTNNLDHWSWRLNFKTKIFQYVIFTKSEEAEGLIPSSHGGTRMPRPSFYLSSNGDGGVSLTFYVIAKTNFLKANVTPHRGEELTPSIW